MKNTFFIFLFIAFSHNLFSQSCTLIEGELNFSQTHQTNNLLFGYNQDHETPGGIENLTTRRLGGNRMTTFNWENGASNSGADNGFTNDNRIPNLLGVPFADRNDPGEAYRFFHQENIDNGLESIVTVPIQGWVAADKNGINTTTPSFPSTRWDTVIFQKPTAFSLTPNTTDGIVYLDESINYLVQTFGDATTTNGVKYISLDNEPGFWDNTHENIQVEPSDARSYVTKVIEAAKAVKAVDPNVKIIGGEFAGTQMYNFGGQFNAPMEGYDFFFDYFLDTLQVASNAAGFNLIDIFSFHFYPQHRVDVNGNFSNSGTIVRNSTNTAAHVRDARMQFARSLWDTSYIEPSFLTNARLGGEPIMVLKRIQSSIDTYFPGIEIMIGEWDWGHDTDISHGVGLVDAFGAMLQENVSISNRWDLITGTSGPTTYTSSVFQLFRNSDGSGMTIGDNTIVTEFNNINKGSIWSSFDSDDDDLHIILSNKDQTCDTDYALLLNCIENINTIEEVMSIDATSTSLLSPTHNAIVDNDTLKVTLPPMSVMRLRISRTPVVLDIDLVEVYEKNQELHWVSSREENSDNYKIFTSTDGTSFSLLQTVPSRNDINGARYSIPLPDGNYFVMVRHFDIDGSAQQFPILYIEASDDSFLSLFPNPFNDFIQVDVIDDTPFQILNNKGQIVRTGTIQNGKISDLSDLTPGSYFLKINQETYTVIKE